MRTPSTKSYLLVDTCSTKRNMLRIAGDDKPTEVVHSRLKKLNADHIRFVLDSLAENTAPVRNMKQYLLAMLYNAPTTMNLYYQNKTNHDFARGSPKAGGCYRKESYDYCSHQSKRRHRQDHHL